MAIMTRENWVLSARQAWSRPWMRTAAIAALALCLAVSTWFLIATVPAVRQSNAFVFHYNIYLGIDDVRTWPWVFFLPAVWLAFTLFDIGASFGMYRTDAHLARSLMVLALAGVFPWAGILFYLSLANV